MRAPAKAILLTIGFLAVSVGQPNNAPVFVSQLPDTTIAQGQSLAFAYVAKDIDGDVVSFSLVHPPVGAAISDFVGILTWSPSPLQVGKFSITVVITDGVLATVASATVTVTDANVRPRIVNRLPDTTVYQMKELGFRYGATDPNNNTLFFNLLNSPPGAAITSSGYFSWKPDFSQKGKFTIVAVVTNTRFSDTTSSAITVLQVNQKPSFTKSLSDTTIGENQPLAFRFVAQDSNNDSLMYALVGGPPGSSVSPNGAFAWTPASGQAGSYTFIVSVSDGSLFDQIICRITVNRLNQKPSFTKSLPDTTIGENQPLAFRFVAQDSNNDSLSYALVGGPPGSSVSPNGAFAWTPASGQAGSYAFIVSVSDGYLSDQIVCRITVTKVNQKPSFTKSLPDTTIGENQPLAFRFVAQDSNNDSLMYALVGGPPGSSVSRNGAFAWTPAIGQAGSYTFIVSVSDGSLSDQVTCRIVVKKVNQKPSFAKILPDTTIGENQPLAFRFVARDSNNDSLMYALVGGPLGSSVSPDGVFTWTPAIGQAGSYTFIVSVSDGSLSDQTICRITVKKLNLKPVLISRSPSVTTYVPQTKPQRFAVTAFDPNGDPISYAWQVDDAVIIESLDSTFIYSFTGPHNNFGRVRVVFSDPGGLRDSTEWSFRITDVPLQDAAFPFVYELQQNFPNPFNPSTAIGFELPESKLVTLEIYSVLGVKTRSLVDLVSMGAGRHQVSWDGRDDCGRSVSSGTYLYRLKAGDFVRSRVMILLR